MEKTKSLSKDFLYCGLTKEAYNEIAPLIVQRNRYMLRFTSVLMAGLALLMLCATLIIKGGYDAACFPYVFMSAGGVLSILVRRLFHWDTDRFTLTYSYVQILLVFIYATILGASPQNREDPSTSIVVFLAVMPLVIIDRPIRMFAVMTLSALGYLVCSHFIKTPHAFSTDVMNVVTFTVISMILYMVVSNRNVQEIYKGERERKLQEKIIMNMATVIEERDESTGDHIQGTIDYVREITRRMKDTGAYSGYSNEYFENICRAAPLHDVGKIRIPDSILKKPGPLTPEEFEIMKKHALYGGELIQKTMESLGNQDYFQIAYNIAMHHHERYDGTGYPSGMKGEAIPLEARIMALADVYQALISDRVYKKAYPKEQAIEIMKQGRGTQFDPVLTDLFLSSLEA